MSEISTWFFVHPVSFCCVTNHLRTKWLKTIVTLFMTDSWVDQAVMVCTGSDHLVQNGFMHTSGSYHIWSGLYSVMQHQWGGASPYMASFSQQLDHVCLHSDLILNGARCECFLALLVSCFLSVPIKPHGQNLINIGGNSSITCKRLRKEWEKSVAISEIYHIHIRAGSF
jgi:hypothetical protein